MKKIFNLLKRFSLYISFVIVLGIMIGGYFFNKKTNQEIKKMEEQIKTKYQEVKKYETERDKAPSPELIGKLEKKKNFLEKQFEVMLNSFSTYYPTIPEFTRYPSIEFKEYIYFSEDKLQKMAKTRDVDIPTSLPFPKTGLIDMNLIPSLTKRFEVVKDLIKLVIDAGVTKIDNIAPGEPTSVLFYETIPLKLSISGTSNEIMRCIKYFDNPSSYFTVENVLITNIEENIYKANIDLNAIILKSKKDKQG
ncbi:MAG: Amuc_1100 family pilus-like protein [Candidatus Omnitrophica bacterium]|nr:Amuc_1100 family pilus-like protein [Candidatus Omnitrophota bacterium]